MNENVNKDNNNEQFILEYPENYEEICEMALKKLDFDYASVLKSEIKENSENKAKINIKEPNSNEEEEDDQLIGEENKRSQYVQLDEEVEDFQKEVIQEQDTIITEVKQNEEKKRRKY